MRGCTPGNSRLGQLAGARAHRENSARARRGPSEARLKFFGEAFFQKSFDLALTRRAAHKRKLGKQGLCPAFPGRPSAWALNSRGLHPGQFAPRGFWSPVGTVQNRPSRQARRSLSLVLIKRLAYARGVGRLPSPSCQRHDTSPKGRGETWLPPWGPLRPGGTLPSGRPRRQPRRWHGAAVTERANQKLPQGRR